MSCEGQHGRQALSDALHIGGVLIGAGALLAIGVWLVARAFDLLVRAVEWGLS